MPVQLLPNMITSPACTPGYVHILENVSCQPGTVHTVFDTSAPQRRDVGSLAAAIPAEAAQGKPCCGRRACRLAQPPSTHCCCSAAILHGQPSRLPPAPVLAGAMGIDEEAWSQLEAGVKANGDTAIQPLGGDECRKRCGLQ